MKSSLKSAIALLLCILMLSSVALTSCGRIVDTITGKINDEEIQSEHKDTEKNMETETDTDTETDTYTETEATHTHSFDNWTVTVQPTCIAKGEKTRTCECGEIETEIVAIDRDNHSFSSWQVTVIPTCVTKGIETRRCKCGKVESELVAIDKDNHSFGDWSVTTVPTCTTRGEETRTCVCGETETRFGAVDKNNHSFGAWQVTTDPTCMTKGEETRTCGCGAIETRDVAVDENNHSFGEWFVTQEPTCTVTGEATRLCECGEKQTEVIPVHSVHNELAEKIADISVETAYADLFDIYGEVIAHKNDFGCDIDIEPLLETMLYGRWETENGKYVSYTYVYEDYNNTVGGTWYATNLPTSKVSGSSYYYYIYVTGNNLIVGYEDKITEERTDNFEITFREDGISLYNMVDGQTYELKSNTTYDKVQKDNAKLAYIYIAKNISEFLYPASVKVTQCYVDYETKIVYATIQANNMNGVPLTYEYKLYKLGDEYRITEYAHSYSTNIDISELNSKLQAYVSNGL